MKSKSLDKLNDTIFPLLEKLKKNGYSMIYMSVPVIRFNNGGTTTEYIESPNYRDIIRINCSNEINNIYHTELIELFNKEYPYFINNLIGFRTQKGLNKIEDLIEIIMTSILTIDPDLEHPKILLKKEISGLEELLNSKKVNVRVTVPISNLNIHSFDSDIIIENDIKIFKLTEADLVERVYGLRRYFSLFPRFAVQIDYIDDLIFQNDSTGEPPPPQIIQEIPNIIRKIIYSINLISEGAVNAPMTYTKYLGFAGKLLVGSGVGSERTAWGKLCKIENLNSFIKIYKELSKESFDKFELPLKRLSESELRTDANDSIIDSVIGLEYLLLYNPGSEKYKGEMRYRFSLNYTTLFKQDKLEKRKLALDAYDLRSKIVHGAKQKKMSVKLGNRKISIGSAAKEIREMLRQTLLYLLFRPADNNFYTENFWINRILKQN